MLRRIRLRLLTGTNAACVLIGMLASLGTAWFPAALGYVDDTPSSDVVVGRGGHLGLIYRYKWYDSCFVIAVTKDRPEIDRMPGWVVRSREDLRGTRASTGFLKTWAFGWPLRCMRATESQKAHAVATDRAYWWTSLGEGVPVLPYFPGFAANTALFATCVWLPCIAFSQFRRWRRARRGRCPACGYRCDGLPRPICPECGESLRRVQRSSATAPDSPSESTLATPSS